MPEFETLKVPSLFRLREVGEFEGRPITRVGNTICFPGGFVRELTLKERLKLWLRLPLYLPPPAEWIQELQKELAEREARALLFGSEEGTDRLRHR